MNHVSTPNLALSESHIPTQSFLPCSPFPQKRASHLLNAKIRYSRSGPPLWGSPQSPPRTPKSEKICHFSAPVPLFVNFVDLRVGRGTRTTLAEAGCHVVAVSAEQVDRLATKPKVCDQIFDLRLRASHEIHEKGDRGGAKPSSTPAVVYRPPSPPPLREPRGEAFEHVRGRLSLPFFFFFGCTGTTFFSDETNPDYRMDSLDVLRFRV